MEDLVSRAQDQERAGSIAPILSTQDFDLISLLEIGLSGRTLVVKRGRSAPLYVVKVRWKWQLHTEGELTCLRAEKAIAEILQTHPHPVLRPVLAIFQSPYHLFTLTPYIPCYDLQHVIESRDGPFPIDEARHYAAEICLGLAHLHRHGILYRYLELKHIVLKPDGHITIGNFSLSKPGMTVASRTRTFRLGSSSMAPEVLMDQEYGFAIDWWAFGQALYRMLVMRDPFQGDDEDDIYDAILDVREPFYFPADLDPAAIMILNELLERQPDIRLGSGRTDADEIMSHVFFRDVDWAHLSKLEVDPHPPPAVRVLDIINKRGLSFIVPLSGQQNISDDDQVLFQDFDFTADEMTLSLETRADGS